MATLNQLMEGRRPGEIKVCKLSLGGGSYFIPYFQNVYGRWHGLREDGTNEDYAANNNLWEIYTEPKPKVKRAQYIINRSHHLPFVSPILFKDEVEARKLYPDAVTVERMSETEREFDE